MKNVMFRLTIVLLVFTVAGFLWYLQQMQDSSPISDFTAEQGIGGAANQPQKNIMLAPMEGTAQGGAATLIEENGKLKVTITVAQIPGINSPQPAHIHTGTCPDVGSIVYPLNDVSNGKSETVLNISLATLQKQLPLAINIHQSAENFATYTSCGNIEQ